MSDWLTALIVLFVWASVIGLANEAIERAAHPRLEDIRERGVNVTICPPRTFSRDAGEGPGGAQALKEAARRAWNRQEKFKRAAERAAAQKRAQARRAAGPVRDIAAERAAMAAAQEAAKVARKQRRLAALVAEGLTTDQIAERLGVTRGTVYRQLKAHGLTARPAPRGNSGTAAAQLRADFAAAVAEGLTVPQLRERFGLSDNAVRSRLRHHGLKAAPVPRPPRRVREKAPPRPHPRDTRPEGSDMTWAELAAAMTVPEIAETLGRSLRAVRAGLHKRGLSARPMPRIARAMSVTDDEWRALAATMSVPEISEKLGLSRTCIWRRLHKLGLRARPGKRGGRRADAPPPADSHEVPAAPETPVGPAPEADPCPADAAALAAICADLGITIRPGVPARQLGPRELGCVPLALGEIASGARARRRLRRALHLLLMAVPPDGRTQLSEIAVRAVLAVLAALDAEAPGGGADEALGWALAGVDLGRAAAAARAAAKRAGHPAWVSLGQAMARALAEDGGPEIAVTA
jgi:transposase